jgi:hypothetical protein
VAKRKKNRGGTYAETRARLQGHHLATWLSRVLGQVGQHTRPGASILDKCVVDGAVEAARENWEPGDPPIDEEAIRAEEWKGINRAKQRPPVPAKKRRGW